MSKKKSNIKYMSKSDIKLLDELNSIGKEHQKEMLQLLVDLLKNLVTLSEQDDLLEKRVSILEKEIAILKIDETVN